MMTTATKLTDRQARILIVLKLYPMCWLVDTHTHGYALVVSAGTARFRESAVSGRTLQHLHLLGLIVYGPDCTPPEYYGRRERDSRQHACTVILTDAGRAVLES